MAVWATYTTGWTNWLGQTQSCVDSSDPEQLGSQVKHSFGPTEDPSATAGSISSAMVHEMCTTPEFNDSSTKYLLRVIINHSYGGMLSDRMWAAAFLTEGVKGFGEKVTSPEYLLKFAELHFASHENYSEIMAVFKRSLENAAFLSILKGAKKHYEKGEALYGAFELIDAMKIFEKASELREFKCDKQLQCARDYL